MTANRNRTVSADKIMGLGWIIAAAIFLFNPCMNIIDILPDFFGIVFLINGLRKWGDLCPGIADALQGLEKLKWFMLIKAGAMILIPLKSDDTFVLLLTLVFAVIELIYLYPAIGRVFDGFEYFATRFSGCAVYKNLKNVSALTYIFCVSKAILTVLPELCSLSDYEYDGYVTAGVQIDFANYKTALLIVCLFLTTLIGIMWLINVIPYIKRIGEDTEFMNRIVDQYCAEVASNEGLAIRRSLKSIFLLFTAGTVFMMNIWIDEFNVIPSFIGAVFLLVGCTKLSKFSDTAKWAKNSSLIYLVCSLVSYILSIIFTANYSLADVYYHFEANDLFNYIRIASMLEYMTQFAAIFFIIRELRILIKSKLAPDKDLKDTRLINIYMTDQKELDRKFIISLVLYVISFILNLVLAIFRAEIISELSEFWWIPLILTIIWILYQKFSTNAFYEQIEYKYI